MHAVILLKCTIISWKIYSPFLMICFCSGNSQGLDCGVWSGNSGQSAPPASNSVENLTSGESPVMISVTPVIFKLLQKYPLHCTLVKKAYLSEIF